MANKTINVKGSNVSQDSTHRLVTDAEKSTWNGKANASHTHTISNITNLQTTLDGKAASSHKHTKSQITDFPASLKNPTSIVIKLNGGTTEGTNMFTYDGSGAKTINITAASLGALTGSHTHTKSQITDFPASLKNPKSLRILLNGGTTIGKNAFEYDGSTTISFNITPSSIGAASSSHTHSQYYDANTDRAANTVLAAPNGSAGKATFRTLQALDIPGFYVYGSNTISSSTNDTPVNWWKYSNSVHMYSITGCLSGQPSQYGILLNLNNQGSDAAQIWFTQNCGNVFHRQGNSNGWGGTGNSTGGWALFLDSWNYNNYCLPLSGGTVSGNMTVTGDFVANYMRAYGGINIGTHNEYIYHNNTGNILFRYRESENSTDLYTSIAELRHGIVRMGDTLPEGADLNNYLDSAVYILAGKYTHSPVHYGVFLTFKPAISTSVFVGQLVIGGSIGYNLFWRFRDESGNWGKWYQATKTEAAAGN